MRMTRSLPSVLVLALTAAAFTARASDGAIEINRGKVIAGGVTSSDLPGFPASLDTPGTYLLTSNLSAGPDVDAIRISAANVTLDLNGFEIAGPVTCTGQGTTLSCSGSASGTGISDSSTGGTRVRNGTVRGFADFGINLAADCHVEDVTVSANGGGVMQFAGTGLRTGANCVVTRSVAVQNGGQGLDLGNFGSLSHCSARQNRFAGISGRIGSTVTASAASFNGLEGISVLSGSTVSASSSRQNEGDGISAGSGSLVTGSSTSLNGQRGLSLAVDTGYSNNVITNNTVGTVNVGVQVGLNLCGNDTICP